MNISVADTGVITVSMGGVVVGLIKSLQLRASIEEPVPSVVIELADVRSFTDSALRSNVVKALDKYRSLLDSHPFVTVSGPRDTVPSMGAVIPPDEEAR